MSRVYPNLFIIGAMKSGTTSLHEYLNLHPEIYMSDMKEPGFFVDTVNNIPNDLNVYLHLFKKGEGKKVIGESSTHYTKLPATRGTAKRIKEFAKSANIQPKFIYVMRDPVKRSVSHYWHNIKGKNEHRSLFDAIHQEGVNKYIDYSDYAMQLIPYFEVFDKENIFVLTFEELISDTDNILRKIFFWLGVDNMIELPEDKGIHNALPEQFNKVRGRGLLHKLRYNPVWNIISPLTPKVLKKLAISLSITQVKRNNSNDEAIYAYLKPIFQKKVLQLEKLLGRKFPEWTSLQ